MIADRWYKLYLIILPLPFVVTLTGIELFWCFSAVSLLLLLLYWLQLLGWGLIDVDDEEDDDDIVGCCSLFLLLSLLSLLLWWWIFILLFFWIFLWFLILFAVIEFWYIVVADPNNVEEEDNDSNVDVDVGVDIGEYTCVEKIDEDTEFIDNDDDADEVDSVSESLLLE